VRSLGVVEVNYEADMWADWNGEVHGDPLEHEDTKEEYPEGYI
jgi:hypothetical protein